MAWQWKLIPEQCTGCGICADVCLSGAIRIRRKMIYPDLGSSPCEGCLACAQQCPFGAIEVEELSPAASR